MVNNHTSLIDDFPFANIVEIKQGQIECGGDKHKTAAVHEADEAEKEDISVDEEAGGGGGGDRA